jgi:hypothetical protein
MYTRSGPAYHGAELLPTGVDLAWDEESGSSRQCEYERKPEWKETPPMSEVGGKGSRGKEIGMLVPMDEIVRVGRINSDASCCATR